MQKVLVEYEYAPDKVGLDDEICYMEKDVPVRVIAYGVAAEYCITEGDFDQAVMWHKRYTDAISDICVPKNTRAAKRKQRTFSILPLPTTLTIWFFQASSRTVTSRVLQARKASPPFMLKRI